MGLAPVIVQGLMLPVVRRIAEEPGAVGVLVEQHLALALEVADVPWSSCTLAARLAAPAGNVAGNLSRFENMRLDTERGHGR